MRGKDQPQTLHTSSPAARSDAPPDRGRSSRRRCAGPADPRGVAGRDAGRRRPPRVLAGRARAARCRRGRWAGLGRGAGRRDAGTGASWPSGRATRSRRASRRTGCHSRGSRASTRTAGSSRPDSSIPTPTCCSRARARTSWCCARAAPGYLEILAAGGGILSTVAATRAGERGGARGPRPALAGRDARATASPRSRRSPATASTCRPSSASSTVAHELGREGPDRRAPDVPRRPRRPDGVPRPPRTAPRRTSGTSSRSSCRASRRRAGPCRATCSASRACSPPTRAGASSRPPPATG